MHQLLSYVYGNIERTIIPRSTTSGRRIQSCTYRCAYRKLDMETEEGVEAAWLEEIERRMESLDTGEVKTVSWDEVKERLYKNMNA